MCLCVRKRERKRERQRHRQACRQAETEHVFVVTHVPRYTGGGQCTDCEHLFFLFIMWAPGIELRSPGLVANALTHLNYLVIPWLSKNLIFSIIPFFFLPPLLLLHVFLEFISQLSSFFHFYVLFYNSETF